MRVVRFWWLVLLISSLFLAEWPVAADAQSPVLCDDDSQCAPLNSTAGNLYYCKGVEKKVGQDAFGFLDVQIAKQGVCTCLYGNFEVTIPGISQSNICEFLKSNSSPLIAFVNVIVIFVIVVVIAIGVISILIAGYLYLTAGGSAPRVETAKTLIGAALLGIIIAVSAYVILNTISPQFASNVQEPRFGASDDNYSTPKDQDLVVDASNGLLANDPGNALKVVTINGSAVGPVGLEINLASGSMIIVDQDGSFNYMPAAGFTGQDTFTYTNSNGDTSTVTIRVI